MKKDLFALVSNNLSSISKAAFAGIILCSALNSCHSGYQITAIEGKYIPVTTTSQPDPEVSQFLNTYKVQLDEQMNQVIGYAKVDMSASKPESSLTNFTSDVLMKLDKQYTNGEEIDLALMNVGGHRSPIAKGEVKLGDIYSTYPFENELMVLHLKGTYVKEIFDSYARMGGAGISSTARLRIKDKKITDAKINGKEVEDDRIYTIVTLDYLAEGNNGMQALTKAESAVEVGITLRDYMIGYVTKMQAEGKPIESATDGRILVIE